MVLKEIGGKYDADVKVLRFQIPDGYLARYQILFSMHLILILILHLNMIISQIYTLLSYIATSSLVSFLIQLDTIGM